MILVERGAVHLRGWRIWSMGERQPRADRGGRQHFGRIPADPFSQCRGRACGGRQRKPGYGAKPGIEFRDARDIRQLRHPVAVRDSKNARLAALHDWQSIADRIKKTIAVSNGLLYI